MYKSNILIVSNLFLFIITTVTINAQSLAFDQVRFEEYSVTVPGGTIMRSVIGSSSLIVPAGKVMKIESIASGYTDASIPRPLKHNGLFEFYLNVSTTHTR